MSNEIPAREAPVQNEERTKTIGHYAVSKPSFPMFEMLIFSSRQNHW